MPVSSGRDTELDRITTDFGRESSNFLDMIRKSNDSNDSYSEFESVSIGKKRN